MLANKKLNLVIAIIAAISIWVYVTVIVNPEDKTTIKGIPVELVGLEALAADGLTVSNDSYAVDVTVSGSRSDRTALRPEDFKAVANIKGYPLGTNPVTVEITCPGRVTYVGQKPERIEVTVEEMVSVAKPIRLSYSKKFPKGMEPGFVSLSPQEIDVSGTKDAVSNVAFVNAEINSDELTEEKTTIAAEAVPSKTNGDRVYDVNLSQSTIDVTATLCHVKEVPLVIGVTGELDEGLTITKQDIPSTVSIRGSARALKGISEVRAESIDLTNLEETAIIEPDLILPDGVELADASRDLTVTIEIGGVEAREFTFTADQIEVIGIKDGYAAHVNTGTITVTVFGTADLIRDLTAEDLRVYVNLKDADYTAEFVDAIVKIKFTKKLARVESDPDQVRIIITKMPESNTMDPATPTEPAVEPDPGVDVDEETVTGAGTEAEPKPEAGTEAGTTPLSHDREE
jgi:YbbR domain-containing protein